MQFTQQRSMVTPPKSFAHYTPGVWKSQWQIGCSVRIPERRYILTLPEGYDKIK